MRLHKDHVGELVGSLTQSDCAKMLKVRERFKRLWKTGTQYGLVIAPSLVKIIFSRDEAYVRECLADSMRDDENFKKVAEDKDALNAVFEVVLNLYRERHEGGIRIYVYEPSVNTLPWIVSTDPDDFRYRSRMLVLDFLEREGLEK